MIKTSPGVLAAPHEVLTPDEWRSRGRAGRKLVPRPSHAEWAPPPDRPDPVAILEEQARGRVPDLVPIRYGRMAASPFAYFRGAAAPMAWDLAHTPTTDIRVQACGDAHLRQLHDMKGSMSVPLMDPRQFDYYGKLCGWALARAHARTARATLISGYLGGNEDFDHAIADFAIAYADQNEKDHQRLLEAISAGRVQATVER